MDRPPYALDFTVESTSDAALQAREALSQLLEVMAGETYADLRLVVSELVTNSVEHGPAGPVSVSIELLAPGGVCGWVCDGGPGGVEITENGDPGTGLGLLIVNTLAASWGTRRDSSDVWFKIDPPDAWGPSGPQLPTVKPSSLDESSPPFRAQASSGRSRGCGWDAAKRR